MTCLIRPTRVIGASRVLAWRVGGVLPTTTLQSRYNSSTSFAGMDLLSETLEQDKDTIKTVEEQPESVTPVVEQKVLCASTRFAESCGSGLTRRETAAVGV
jgi:hypothetical protein